MYFERGCNLFLDGRQFDLAPGTVLLIHYNDLHRIIKQSTDEFERVYIFLTPEFLKSRSTKATNLEECFQPLGDRKSKVLKTDSSKLSSYLKALDAQPNAQEYGADLKYEQRLLDFMIYLNQLILKEEHESKPKRVIENERIEEMITYISNHLDHSLTLEEMEKNFYVSKYYVTREFKKHTGFTFHQFVLKKKLLYSKQLLKEYQNSSEVFIKCGFKSYPHFLKCFKREFGMTPKEFLERNKANQMIYYNHFKEKPLEKRK